MKSGNRGLRNKVIVVLGSFLFVCLGLVFTPCPANQNQLNVPAYIESLWPPPESETWFGCYVKRYLLVLPSGTGVGLTIDTANIWELEILQPSSGELSPFQDRVFLYVDGEQVPLNRQAEGGGSRFITVNNQYVDLELAGWYFFGSSRFLSLGDHLAKVVIFTKSGETLEYEWRFKIK